ncbi:MAG TPA: D-aminoacyl-tRNA deacylase [Ilumatobacter sp.]|nr:D-aminoacyl-tRNA deacylase [Ilumatobacter sp.]
MRGLVQRVLSATVEVSAGDAPVADTEHDHAAALVGEIGRGLCVFVGVTHGDAESHADKLAAKIWNLRILDDAQGVMNRSLADIANEGQLAAVLIVSQFTLYGDTRKGRRPSWTDAARPEHAEPLVQRVVDQLRGLGTVVATGRFRTDMRVSIVNDGPVTLMIEV